jgi:hypothetical protein
MEVTGKLHVKFDTQDVSASFRKRDFVLMIADNPQYPQYVSFQLTQEKCAFLDLIAPGSDITISFNLRGRQWTSPQGETKYFNTLEVWRVLPAGTNVQSNTNSGSAPTVPQPQSPAAVDITAMDDSDDLPF